MAPAVTKTRSQALGVPSQHSQSSRKGKKAWRKHIDLDEVEEGLEEIRTEEIVVGSAVHNKTNNELFQVDLTGDTSVSKKLPKFSMSELTSSKILAQRSALPAVFSRSSSEAAKKSKYSVSREDKVRLLRIGKRKRLGPLNSVMDPTEFGNGSALLGPSRAVKESGKYDVWAEEEKDEDLEGLEEDFVPETVKKQKIKAPQVPSARSSIQVPAVMKPHEGISYNPPVDSHQELLRLANNAEERKEKESAKYAGVKEAVEAARHNQSFELGVQPGMTVDIGGPDDDDGDDAQAADVVAKSKLPQRKTKQQRRKAQQLKAEKRALQEKIARKRMLAVVYNARSLRSAAEKARRARERAKLEKRAAEQKNLEESGLAGKRLGKHVVPEGRVDVHLGEELSENLRGLQVEGNLFRDRFISLQQRALLEPRAPVLPKKKRAATKDVEKFMWKRFD